MTDHSDAAADARLTSFVAGYRRLVRAVIARVGGPTLRDNGDDVEQRVWIAIWRRLQREQDVDHPTSYIYTVARREAVRAVQEALTRVRADETAAAVDLRPRDDPHQQVVARESGERIRAAMRQLAPDRRRAIQAHLSGLDVDEIQDLFGWSYERARNLIARGRADLRALLKEE